MGLLLVDNWGWWVRGSGVVEFDPPLPAPYPVPNDPVFWVGVDVIVPVLVWLGLRVDGLGIVEGLAVTVDLAVLPFPVPFAVVGLTCAARTPVEICRLYVGGVGWELMGCILVDGPRWREGGSVDGGGTF